MPAPRGVYPPRPHGEDLSCFDFSGERRAASPFQRRLAAQAPVDSALARYINSIRAIDNHAHPMRPVAQGAPADTEFDALPLDGIPPFDLPNRLKPDDPIWRAAQNALYHIAPDRERPGVPHGAQSRRRQRAARAQGQRFPNGHSTRPAST